MNKSHIFAIVLRNLYVWVRELDRVFDAFWWAFFDVVIWGLMSTYFAGTFISTDIFGQLITGIILWAVLARSQWEVSASLIIESWERNLINIFTSPLTIAEFLSATVLLGIGKVLIIFFFMAGLVLLFYQFNIFTMSWWILPILSSLFLTSVWLALFINALILRWGKSVLTFAWTLVLVINPISGVVYPLSTLPPAFQSVARFVPSSYVFEGMRSILTTGTMDPSLLVTSFFLNGLYLVGSVTFFLYMFGEARRHGRLIKLM